MKHSRSPTIHVRLRQDHALVLLEVTDQGIGFNPAQDVAANSFGLRGIRERARLLGGHATIDSAGPRNARRRGIARHRNVRGHRLTIAVPSAAAA